MPTKDRELRLRYQRDWYSKNKHVYLEKNQRTRDRNRQFLLDYLLEHPCVDCGEADPIVLEFDHVGEKTGEVTKMAVSMCSLRRLRAEIERCEVVCANCHKRRTYSRVSSFRTRMVGSQQMALALHPDTQHPQPIQAA